MKEILLRYQTVLITDLVLFILCIAGLYQIAQKADLPIIINSTPLLVVDGVKNNNNFIKPNDRLLSVDNLKFNSREEIELYTDGKEINTPVVLELKRGAERYYVTTNFVQCYSVFYLVTAFLTGFIFFFIAIFVYINATEKLSAAAFHNVVVATAVIIMMTWGNYNVEPFGLGYIIRFIFHTAYSFAPSLFLHFALVFPSNRVNSKILFSFYSLSSFISVALNVVFVLAVTQNNLSYFAFYINLFNLCRFFIVISVLSALVLFIRSYFKTTLVTEKKKLKWILLGLIVGPGAFVFLWVIPQSITTYGLVPEELIVLLMTSVPIAFGISIVRYHLLDIDLVLRRSLIYTVVILLLLIIYIAVIVGFSASFNYANSGAISIVAAIVIALLSQPVKQKVQSFVDKKFYHVRYNFNMALEKLFEAIKNSADIESLCGNTIGQIQAIIPVKEAEFYFVEYLLNSIGSSIYSGKTAKPKWLNELIENRTGAEFWGVKNYIEPGLNFKHIECNGLKNDGCAVIFPVNNSQKRLIAMLLLGGKKAENKYTFEDIDLLKKVTNQVGLTIERIQLQENVIKGKLEQEKLEELNRLKSLFISGVSHELKTPLTSIRIFSELMSSPNLSPEKRLEYFNTIEGESNRLTLMINNILNFAKIEKGTRQFLFSEIDLSSVVKQGIKLFEYQLNSLGFYVSCNTPEQSLIVYGDENALLEVITNLISNSIKYSKAQKHLEINGGFASGNITLKITDKGVGIEKEEIEKIFEPFYRAGGRECQGQIEGAGLGLSIVKHIIDAHNGSILYESEKGKGTTVTLTFPSI